MRTDEAGRDPPVHAEVLHESARTRVTRLTVGDRTVVRKEPLGPDAARRLRHEVAMLTRLRGVVGIAQLAPPPRPGAITLADVGGTSLAELAKPLTVEDLVSVASGLARAVAWMHRRGVMHRDISPGNVVLGRDGTPCLVDFALATPVAELRPEFTHHSEIVGTLAYLAPEMTGRTGRSVDQRADLYALGATLYELATGAAPFGRGDARRLVHDHLTRVPVPAAQVDETVPGPLSEIITHLLEKEPDRRYQTAEGLVHDLERLGGGRPVDVGAHDFPFRVVPPSRLVGRDDQVTALHAAFDDAVAGRCRGVLIGGAPGVGKTALADQLRPVVTGCDGWFVAGKFDPYRRDLEFDAGHQAFRALGRLLLAEPDGELARLRERVLDAVGPNAGLLVAVLPEFAELLAVPPDPGDPLTAQVRVRAAAAAVVAAVASRERPVVVFVDDLQWAGRVPLGLVDLLLSEPPVEGLLLVGAYRDSDLDPAHPLAGRLPRWRDQDAVRHLRLANLPASSLVTMVAEMLRVDRAVAAALVETIEPHTSGNPYETVELLNALRRDGGLTPTAAGWRWNAAVTRRRLGKAEMARLMAARVDAMPASTRAMVEAMASLGGRAEMGVLRVAAGEPAEVVDEMLAPALDNGVLVAEPGVRPAVRFRHDRTREVVLRGVDTPRRRTQRLAMARRLAVVPELFAVAAEQYLPVVDAVEDVEERRTVVALLRRAADQARLTGDNALVNALTTAALALVDPADTDTIVDLRTRRHTALYSLGRFDEADEEYRRIQELCPTPLGRVAATAVQVRSLTHRRRFGEAITVGIASLREFGILVPADRHGTLDRQFEYLYRWLDHTDAGDDLTRPDITDPELLATTRLIYAVLPAAYFVGDGALQAWLSLEALRIWLEHGPGRTLVSPASTAAFQAVALRGDDAGGYRAVRRVLALGEARGYEADIAQTRYLAAVLGCWFEPVEDTLAGLRRAREGLIAGGDLAWAGYTYYPAVAVLLDSAPTLDACVAEVDAGLAFVGRTHNVETRQCLEPLRWLAGVLRGEHPAGDDAAVPVDRYADNPLAMLHVHVSHALAAAVFGDLPTLARRTAAAMPLLPAALGLYPVAVARMLRGLALARQVRDSGEDRDALLSELDDVTRWLAIRAANAPDNFLHMLRFVEAERAWALGDFQAAVLAFDAAQRDVAMRHRPWHRALIIERAARFYVASGADHTGYSLLAQARQAYDAWGAAAKVAQLDRAYPPPRTDPTPGRRGTGATDLLGIVSAARTLSSETSVERLHARVVDVLGAMTGATHVHLLLNGDDRQGWLLPGGDRLVPAGGHAVPMSVLRYVQRTGEPLVIGDALRDDRFARDPYLAGVAHCSVLAVPVPSRGTLKAVLVLENRLVRGAFTTERFDTVKLIAGQLAVSLENAQLHAALTASRARIVAAADRTRHRIERDLREGTQQRLVSAARLLRSVRADVPPHLAARLDEVAAGLTDALDELRELARGIHPAILADGGLRPALRALARRSPVPVRLDLRVDGRLPEPVEVAVYYLAAETLTNAAEHAHATVIDVDIGVAAGDGVVCVEVRDDGRGGADLAGGSGLVGLRDRVEALGGRFEVRSVPGAGTTVSAELPLGPAR